MRIAYITNSTEGGGAALPIPAVTRVLRNLGAEVRVFALEKRDGHALPSLVAAGLDPLVRSGGKHDHFSALRWLDAQTRAWGATHLWTALSRSAALGLWLGRRNQLPTFCYLMNALPSAGNRIVLRSLQKHARAWIAISHSTAQLASDVLEVEDARIMTWPTFAANAAAPVAAPWLPGETLLVGSLGRLHPVKGYDILVDAMARLRQEGFRPPVPYTVTIGGEGAERARLMAAARKAGIQDLLMPGYTAHPGEFLARKHLYVQPSRSEGLCVAALEAMVAGLPVLASAVGEFPYFVLQDETGITVPPEDPGALADGLFQLLSHPERLHEMGVKARALVFERYSEQRFRAAGLELFTRMTEASAGFHTASHGRSDQRV